MDERIIYMIVSNQIINEIEKLPLDCFQEIMDFIGYIKLKHYKNIPETMILSEKSLAKDWDTPEEDEAWADL
jgi:hypothetical protein